MTTYGPDFNGVVRSVPERGSCEPVRFHFSDEQWFTVTDADGRQHEIGKGWLAITEAEYAALTVPEARKAVVKPLEWKNCASLGGGRKLIAMDCFGNEFARLDLAAQGDAAINKFMADRQTDYEQRIRSALASDAAPSGAEEYEHHEFVADPYRPSQCLNCARHRDARVHDVAQAVPAEEVAGKRLRVGDYPIGTKAYSSIGGYWTRVAAGWQAMGGDVFPRYGGDAIEIELPATTSLRKWLGELLAVIHRDGGHHQDFAGTEQAVADAQSAVVLLFQAQDERNDLRRKLEELYRAILGSEPPPDMRHGQFIEMIKTAEAARAGAIARAEVAEAALNASAPVVSIKPMKLADDRCDYFVSFKCGDREVTPHVFRERFKAEWHVAEYRWLFGQGPKPGWLEFRDGEWPAREFTEEEQRAFAALAAGAAPSSPTELDLPEGTPVTEIIETLRKAGDPREVNIGPSRALYRRAAETITHIRRVAVDRLYMMQAYRSMLGEKGQQLAHLWDERGVTRVHHDWTSAAADLTGERRAEELLRWETAPVEEVIDVDAGSPTPAAVDQWQKPAGTGAVKSAPPPPPPEQTAGLNGFVITEPVPQACPHCDGSGWVDDQNWSWDYGEFDHPAMSPRLVPCERCGSEGRIYVGALVYEPGCGHAHWGERDDGECSECRGAGEIQIDDEPIELEDLYRMQGDETEREINEQATCGDDPE